jgi:hypothetical protein
MPVPKDRLFQKTSMITSKKRTVPPADEYKDAALFKPGLAIVDF